MSKSVAPGTTVFRVYEGWSTPRIERAEVSKVTARYVFLEDSPLAFGCRRRFDIGEDFATTREQAWEQWKECLHRLRDQALNEILDIDKKLALPLPATDK